MVIRTLMVIVFGLPPPDRDAWQSLPMASPHLENAQERIRDRETVTIIPLHPREEQEWSEEGRRPDTPPGWYVIPAFLLALGLIAAVILMTA
jgi:hypothetical protein